MHQLLEDAASRVAAGDTSGGVDAARDAVRREQRLCAMLEQSGWGDQISLDLKFAVSLGLAAAYEANQQLDDGLAIYEQVLRSRLFPQVRRCAVVCALRLVAAIDGRHASMLPCGASSRS